MDASFINQIMNSATPAPKSTLNCDDDFLSQFSLIIFSDGACSGNGGRNSNAGMGVYTYVHGVDKHSLKNMKVMRRLDCLRYFKHDAKQPVSRGAINIVNGGDAGLVSNLPTCAHVGCGNIGYAGTDGCDELYCTTHKNTKHVVKYNYTTFLPTNNRGEGIAILVSLQIILAHARGLTTRRQVWEKIKDYPKMCNQFKCIDSRTVFESGSNMEMKTSKYMIVSDSKLWINIICNWSNTWIRRGIIMEKKNIDIIIWINNVLAELEKEDVSVVMQHVNGHFDSKEKNKAGEELTIYHRGNIVVDKLATHAVRLGNTEIAIV